MFGNGFDPEARFSAIDTLGINKEYCGTTMSNHANLVSVEWRLRSVADPPVFVAR